MPAPRSGCLDLGKSVVTSLRMSRSRKECRHLAPDVSILERVSVTGPGCRREGCISCVVMSTYVSCAGMSRRTYGSCENCVYKEGCLPCFVFFFSSCNLLYSIRNINLVSVSSVSSVSTVSPYRRRSSSAARFCPTRPYDAVRLSVRHVCLTLSVLVRHVRPTLSVSVSHSRSRSCSHSHSHSLPVSVPVPAPLPFPVLFPPPPLPLPLSRASPELTQVP